MSKCHRRWLSWRPLPDNTHSSYQDTVYVDGKGHPKCPICLCVPWVCLHGRRNIFQWQLLPEPFGQGHGGKMLPWEPSDGSCVTVTAARDRKKEQKGQRAVASCQYKSMQGEKLCNEPHIPKTSRQQTPSRLNCNDRKTWCCKMSILLKKAKNYTRWLQRCSGSGVIQSGS